jgi:hypothetical protein
VTNNEKALFLELAKKYLDEVIGNGMEKEVYLSPTPATKKKNGAVKAGKEKWLMHASRGRTPGWIIEATGIKDKKKLKEVFGTDAVFTKGGKLPPKMGE